MVPIRGTNRHRSDTGECYARYVQGASHELPKGIERIAGESGALISVYLFGSRNESRSHRESDVDLGLLFDRETCPTRADRFEEQLRLIGRLERPNGPRIDALVLNDVPPLLARQIVNSGRRVFCRDENADHVFVRDTLLRAADLEPFLERMRRLKLESLAR